MSGRGVIGARRQAGERVPASVRQAKFHMFARCWLSTGRVELTGKNGVTRHFQVIREGNEVRCAKLEGDRIVPIGIGEFKAHIGFAIGQRDGAEFDRPVRGDGEVRQAASPDSDEVQP